MVSLRPVYARRVTIVDVSAMLYTYTSVSKNLKSKDSFTVKGINVAGVKAVFDLCAKNYRLNRRTVLCMDTFSDKRRQSKDGYKANRKFAPEIAVQSEIVAKYFPLFGVDVLRMQGIEADDLIYSAVLACKQEFVDIEVITGDKDIYGCITEEKIHVVGVNSNCPSVDIHNFREVADSRDFIELNCILPYLTFFGKPSNNLGVLKVNGKHKEYYNNFVTYVKERGLEMRGSELQVLLDFMKDTNVPTEHMAKICERAVLVYPRYQDVVINSQGPEIDTEKLIQFCSVMRFNTGANMFGLTGYLNSVSPDKEISMYLKRLFVAIKNETLVQEMGIVPELAEIPETTPTSEFMDIEDW